MKQTNAWIKREEGFTLIEMSLVLFIISALLLLFVPNLSGRQTSAATTGDEAIASVLQSQVDMYKMDKKEAPASFEVLKTAGYLTEKQLAKAITGFDLVNGVVKAKTETSLP
ncbi:competence type IV pilus major pilin ComGC [Alkalibacterium putridalgicola]|uniref:competence type IV pilus major pilin ComGC n=1 Tax=Alkalibacterium putridalgicola TaxID=426703 RepID=UPI0034CF4E26